MQPVSIVEHHIHNHCVVFRGSSSRWAYGCVKGIGKTHRDQKQGLFSLNYTGVLPAYWLGVASSKDPPPFLPTFRIYLIPFQVRTYVPTPLKSNGRNLRGGNTFQLSNFFILQFEWTPSTTWWDKNSLFRPKLEQSCDNCKTTFYEWSERL